MKPQLTNYQALTHNIRPQQGSSHRSYLPFFTLSTESKSHGHFDQQNRICGVWAQITALTREQQQRFNGGPTTTLGSLSLATTTATATRTSQMCIFSEQKQQLCTLCTCIFFHFCSFLCRRHQNNDGEMTKFEVLERTSALEINLHFLL